MRNKRMFSTIMAWVLALALLMPSMPVLANPIAPKLQAVTSIDFTFEFNGESFKPGDVVCIRHTIGSWANTFQHVEIDELNGPDYEFTYRWSFPASSNFYHLGRLGGCAEGVSDDPSLMFGSAKLKKMVVSDGTDEYIFELDRAISLTNDGECSIGNAWMGGMSNGAKLYESIDGLAFFEFNNQDGGGLKFYVIAPPEEPVMETDRSLRYAEAMGNGWNLGNSFDAVNQAIPELGGGETAWNNPAVTKELIDYIATKFDHIRIPMTAFTRFTDKGDNTPADEIRYELDSAWLSRYKEVVQWAVDAGLYVMINLHHDSNRWFEKFSDDESVQSEEVKRTFLDLWKQLAAEFAAMPDEVMFETINEPEPDIIAGGKTQQERLDILNKAAYDIIRQTPGNETRMIVFSTIYARFGDSEMIGVRDFIRTLNDENILATVHFYHPTYGFSVNLGETMYASSQSAGVENFYETLKLQLTDFGIGVSVGEWGLLAYDEGHPNFDGHLQHGEELKFYEHMKHLKTEADGVSLTFWDNGSGIRRWDGSGPRTGDFSWQFPRMGEMVTGSGRSSYPTGLDTAFYRAEAAADLDIPLTLNGNAFSGIIGLTDGVDYTYSGSTLTLKKEFINDSFNRADNGIFETLTFTFNNGADWEYYLIKHGTPKYGSAEGSRSAGITVPLTFNGARVETVRAFINGTATRIGSQQSWAPGLQYADNGYKLDYINGSIIFGQQFFGPDVISGTPVPVGPVELEISVAYFDGQSGSFVLEIEADGAVTVKVRQSVARTAKWILLPE
ncbi:MAG: cellulase family glycosylhydrolase [Lachnospiraceae bacterium]|nr:cellulase family glycosylhydrolase [Lachnospiraceae bacterium]